MYPSREADHAATIAACMSASLDRLASALHVRIATEIDLPPQAQAAVALILAPRVEDSGLEALLIRRAERAGDPWSGHMALPGGRREPSDVDLIATACRETREETGLDLGEARVLGRLDDLRPIRQSERVLAVRPFVFALPVARAPRPSAEVAESLWIPLDELRRGAGEVWVEHRGTPLRVAAFRHGERIIWGMTQRALAALLELDA